MSLTVTGLSEVVRFNKNISNNKKYEQMMTDIVRDTVSLMLRRAPVDTGRLRDNIYWIKQGNGQYKIYVAVPYAYYMEYGFSGFDIGTIEQPKYMKSGYHPFMRSSVWEMNKIFPWYLNKNVFNK